VDVLFRVFLSHEGLDVLWCGRRSGRNGAAGDATPAGIPVGGGPEWTEGPKGCGKPSFSAKSENALLLVRLEIFDGVYNSTDGFEIVLRRIHKILRSIITRISVSVLVCLAGLAPAPPPQRFDESRRVVVCGKLGGELTVTATVHQILAEFRHGLERIYGARLAGLVLFGSQARGDALPDSDIDVMVVLHGRVNPLQEARRISQFRGDLCLSHCVVITCVYVSAEEALAAGSPLLQNIRTEGVTV